MTRRFKPIYKAQTGVQSVTPDFSAMQQFLQEERVGNPVVNSLESVGTTALNFVAPGVGSAVQLSGQLGEAIRGDQTDPTGNVIGNLIDPVGGIFNPLAEGRFDEAIPVLGGIRKANRIKKEKERLESTAKREAEFANVRSRTINDPTKIQQVAKEGRRYVKGSKEVDPIDRKGKSNFEAISKQAAQFQGFFSPESIAITPDAISNLGSISRQDIIDLDKFARNEIEESDLSNPDLLLSSLKPIAQIRKAFTENPFLQSVDVGDIDFSKIPDVVIDGKETKTFGKGSTGPIPFRFTEVTPPVRQTIGLEDVGVLDNRLPVQTDNINTNSTQTQTLPKFGGVGRVEGFRFATNRPAKGSIGNRARRRFKGGSKRLKIAQSGLDISATDTVPVEVERNEMLFRKINGKFKLVADFKNGATHEAGGIDIEAQEGDVIIPGNKRGDILKILGKNGVITKEGEPAFESIRLQLPKEGEEAQLGLNIDPNTAISTVSRLIPAVSNISLGSQRPQRTTRRFVSPEEAEFVDISQEALNLANTAFTEDVENITRFSGGQAGTLLSNVGAATARRNRARSNIAATTAQRAQQVENFNVRQRNIADRINTNLALGFDIQDLQNEAAINRFLQEGLTQVSDIGQQLARERGLASRDERMQSNFDILERILGSEDFSFERNAENPILFRQPNKDNLNIPTPESLGLGQVGSLGNPIDLLNALLDG